MFNPKLVKLFYFLVVLIYNQPIRAEEDDIMDFEFSHGSEESEPDVARRSRLQPELVDFALGRDEQMVAQESRLYQTVVKPPVLMLKPNGVTNSHRPQYHFDSFEDVPDEKKAKAKEPEELEELEKLFTLEERMTHQPKEKEHEVSHRYRVKEVMVRDAVLRALERKDHIRKFAQILPIIRAMSSSQRLALASLVASQVTAPPGRKGLNLVQVRSMFGNDANATSDLMLPILLDMANLFRRAVRAGKGPRETLEPYAPPPPPPAPLLRRSFTEEEGDVLYDDDEDIGVEEPPEESTTTTTTTAKPTTTTQSKRAHMRMRNTNRITRQQPRTEHNRTLHSETATQTHDPENRLSTNTTNPNKDETKQINITSPLLQSSEPAARARDSAPALSPTTAPTPVPTPAVSVVYPQSPLGGGAARSADDAILDQAADATNNSLAEDLPVAERLRSWFNDRKMIGGKPGRRPAWTHPARSNTAAGGAMSRRVTAEPAGAGAGAGARRRPPPALKLHATPRPADLANCELFTNSLCLEAEDYPTEAILSSIRRNKAAAGALLAEYEQPGEGAPDGVSAAQEAQEAQEAQYTAEHYLHADRRGDSAGAGEAGFMCPSSVKYARPQRARATSGSWKYIVNTGEHTQTLRLEKCLKPKESCTYLTDNFKSKCVQVYNYHRLLTWDQQNGLHMDIFKVPTCCSCHIEGYSVSFPPLGQRTHETSSERFPGRDLSSEAGNSPFEVGQATVMRPSITKNTSPFLHGKPTDTFSAFGDPQNLIQGVGFNSPKYVEGDDLSSYNTAGSAPMDSYGNSYFPDSFNQASSIRNVKNPPVRKQVVASNHESSATLPSYLEPPTQSAAPMSSTFFVNLPEPSSKYKYSGSQYKRVKRPVRRPIRKNTSGVSDDLMSSGSSVVKTQTAVSLETMEDFNDELDELRAESQAPNQIFHSAPSQQSSTAEVFRQSTTQNPYEQGATIVKDISSNKRVNYNYHPIIDFFETGSKQEEAGASDREDSSLSTYTPLSDSEWKPMNKPPNRNNQITKSLSHHIL